MIENFYRTYDGRIERKRKWNVCFVWFISNTFLFSFFSLLYLALRKKLCIKDHKDPKNLCEKHRCFNYK